jgi:hypothetical protein
MYSMCVFGEYNIVVKVLVVGNGVEENESVEDVVRHTQSVYILGG